MMDRNPYVLVFGDAGPDLRIRPAPGMRKGLQTLQGQWQNLPSGTWILVPEKMESAWIPGGLGPRLRRVRHLDEAVRFVESLAADERDVRRLLEAGIRASPLPDPVELLPLHGRVTRGTPVEILILLERDPSTLFGDERVPVRLLEEAFMADLFREREPRWVAVEGPAKIGKTLWTWYLEDMLRRRNVPVLRIDVDWYGWGDGNWAEEIVEAYCATHGIRSPRGPRSRLARWLVEGVVSGGVLILDQVEGARPWKKWMRVLDQLRERWRGWVLLVGRTPAFRELATEGFETEMTHVEIVPPPPGEVQAWVNRVGGNGSRIRSWYATLDLPWIPGMVHRVWRWREEAQVEGAGQVYGKIIEEGIRTGLTEMGLQTGWERVDVLLRALSRTLGVVLGTESSYPARSAEFAMLIDVGPFGEYFPKLEGGRGGARTLIWDEAFGKLLQWNGQVAGGVAWKSLESMAAEILIRGLSRAGVWTVVPASDGEATVEFASDNLVAFLGGAGCWDLWGEEAEVLGGGGGKMWWLGYVWGRLRWDKASDAWVMRLWENDLEMLALVGCAAPDKLLRVLERKFRESDSREFLSSLRVLLSGFRQGETHLAHVIGRWLLSEKGKTVAAWLERGPSDAQEEMLGVLKVLSWQTPELVWDFLENHKHVLLNWMKNRGGKSLDDMGEILTGLTEHLENMGSVAAFLKEHREAFAGVLEKPHADKWFSLLRSIAHHDSDAVRSLLQALYERIITWMRTGQKDVSIRALKALIPARADEVWAFLKKHAEVLTEGVADREVRKETLEIIRKLCEKRPGSVWKDFWRSHQDMLEKVLREGDPAVPTMLLQMLQRCAEEAPEEVWQFLKQQAPLLETLLMSPHGPVRVETLKLLEIAGGAYPEEVWGFWEDRLSLFQTLWEDTDLDVRVAMVMIQETLTGSPPFFRCESREIVGNIWAFWEAHPGLLDKLFQSQKSWRNHLQQRFPHPGNLRLWSARFRASIVHVLKTVAENAPARVWRFLTDHPTLLERMFQDEDSSVQEAALEFLDDLSATIHEARQFLERQFIRWIRECECPSADPLLDTQESVWHAVADTLWEFWGRHSGLLESLLKDPDVRVRRRAVSMLYAISSEVGIQLWKFWEARLDLLEQLLQDRDEHVREKALRMLAKIARRDSAGVYFFWKSRGGLRDSLLGDDRDRVRRRAWELHRALSPGEEGLEAALAKALPAWLEDHHEGSRKKVAEALAMLAQRSPEKVLEVLDAYPEQVAGLLEDEDFQVCQEAVHLFLTLHHHNPEAVVAFWKKQRHRLGRVLNRSGRDLFQKVFWVDPGLAWEVDEEQIPSTLHWMIRSFRLIDRARRMEAPGIQPCSREERNVEVKVVWGEIPGEEKGSGGVRIGCVDTEGRCVELTVRWRRRKEDRDFLCIHGEGDRREKEMLEHVWRRYRKSPGWEVAVNAGGRALKGSVLFGALLGIALAARSE